jgi:hypothetical protein
MASLYSYQSNPIIQCGTATLNANGDVTVTFPTAYTTPITTSNIYITSNATGNQGTSVVSLSIHTITLTNFQIRGYYKDGRAGQNGGGPYTSSVNWIAVIY